MWFILSSFVAVAVSYPFLQGFYTLFQMNYARTHNFQKSLAKTVHTIVWVIYLILYQKIKKNVRLVGRGEYEVDYVLHEECYSFRVMCPRGPHTRKVLQVINEHDEDVTDVIQRYMGPMEDCHGHVYTPQRLGYKQLTFNLFDGTTLVFEEQNVISLEDK